MNFRPSNKLDNHTDIKLLKLILVYVTMQIAVYKQPLQAIKLYQSYSIRQFLIHFVNSLQPWMHVT